MQIVRSEKNPPRVTVMGEIDFSACRRLRSELNHASQDDCKILEIDLSGVDFIDSSGIVVLLDTAKALRKQGKELHVVMCSDNVYRVLFSCGVAEVLGVPSGGLRTDRNDYSGCGKRWLVSSFTVPASMTSPGIIRDRVSQIISDLQLSDDDVADIKLAVGEAATNAFKYGCTESSQKIHIKCIADNCRLTIEITDPGCGFDRTAVCPPDFANLPTGGMGIAIMEMIMDEVTFRVNDGMTVRMVKQLQN
ncbi:MAG TPA: anti-sigma factor antagonist [Armatimonadota bacterium]|nr:anti-sigma factor antagonist [Armatimonadota bacterium]HOP79184.1 anti-sigma factor antagonist [Armatimonadota bacterium]HPP73633.1 anti-sigma factor antagonist [Armatimonadota bacterium]